MVDFARFARFDHEADTGALLLTHQVVVDRRDEQDRRDRRELGGRVPVGEDDDVRAARDRFAHLGADPIEGFGEGRAPSVDPEQAVDGEGVEARRAAGLVDVEELGQLVVVDHRELERDLAARRRFGRE